MSDVELETMWLMIQKAAQYPLDCTLPNEFSTFFEGVVRVELIMFCEKLAQKLRSQMAMEPARTCLAAKKLQIKSEQ